MNSGFNPYISAEKSMKELSVKAVVLGVFLAIILGAANAYLGLKAGMTVAATFPAAVIAMAVLRIFKGTILEENIARTTGAVGEALAAGAIFTIPAFIMSGVWKNFSYWQSTAVMVVGGVLGVLFVVILRRTLVEDKQLPFPESVACTEIVKAGQKGSTGAGYVFGALGLAALIELFKNPKGITIIKSTVIGFIPKEPMVSIVKYLKSDGSVISQSPFQGRFFVESPAASPAILGVGYIIGPRLAAIAFSGGCFGWLLLMPLMLFLSGGDLSEIVNKSNLSWTELAYSAYNAQIKPIAVGAMLVGAFYTLYNMRQNLIGGIKRSIKDVSAAKKGEKTLLRTEKDLSFTGVLITIAALVIPMIILYHYFCRSFGHAVIAGIVMGIAGFLFAAVAGYLVGLIGSSSNPISGLTLSTLLIAALLLGPILGLTGTKGVAAVLGVAAVVCCVAGVAGDMIQDWKVGHLLGGTPWKMQVGGVIGVVAAALALTVPLMWLHQAMEGGIGGRDLPAPQAGLMAMMAKGIVGGQMAWPLVIIGMIFSIALILIKSPSPMLIAVGMYLPFHTTFAIFIGGIFKWALEKVVSGINSEKARNNAIEGTGTLLASGLVAGEALTSILLAALFVFNIPLSQITKLHSLQPLFERISGSLIPVVLGTFIFIVVGYVLIYIPYKNAIRFSKEEKDEKG